MARSRMQKLSKSRSSISIFFLLVKFLFLMIGKVPTDILAFLLKQTQRKPLKKKLVKHKLRVRLAKKQTSNGFSLPFFRHKGRPRTTPFLQFYYRRFIKKIKHTIPRPARIIIVFGAFLTIFVIYTFFTFQAAYQIPNPDRLTAPTHLLTTEFYDRNGKLLHRLYEGQNRTLTKIDDLPPYLLQATIAIEDKNFYKHFGLDPVAIVRAFYHNITEQRLEGASTITQQLIKNTILTPEKTYERKIKEIILAFWTERVYTKKQILQ